ncbi:DUF1573 domain-containing protein, partial [Acidobacteriota bacterium]
MPRTSINRAFSLFLLCLIMITCPALSTRIWSQSGTTGPHMVVRETIFKAGSVAEGTVIKHKFIIENKGGKNLVILAVTPQCRCTVAKYDEVIPPGSTGRISIDVDTRGFTGVISKLITVTSNDPKNRTVNLGVVVDVKSYLALHPYKRFSFPRVARSSKQEQSLTLSSVDPEEFKILSATAVPKELSVEVETIYSAKGTGSRYEIIAGLTTDLAPGKLQGEVILKTDLSAMPEYRIPVSGYILGPVRFEPISLNFVRADPKKPETLAKTVTITAEESSFGTAVAERI